MDGAVVRALAFHQCGLGSIRPGAVCGLRRDSHESRILAGYYAFNANISFTFQAVKNLYAHPTNLCFRMFCKFFGDFLLYLEINSFSQRISKIDGNMKF